jgi:hypothetical protein
MSDQHREIVTFPVKCLDFEGSIKAARDLWTLPTGVDYLIDFGPLKWLEPFGMLYFARQLRTFANERKPSRCQAKNHEGHGYAAHMGFFQSFGLNFGKEAGAANGSVVYIPITEVNIRKLHIEAGQSQVQVQEIIERHCARLAAVLARNEGGPLQHTLGFSLREILRNVTEHSNADSIWYAAQYWPNKQLVELSILDQGRGIKTTLSRNPHLIINSDEDAIRLALKPGISGRAYEGAPRLRDDAWANSGYGLFMTSQICARGGSFALCSGDRGLLLNGEAEKVLDAGFSGTAIRMCIYVPEVLGLNEALKEFSSRGEYLAGQAGKSASMRASVSSRMLAKDFSSK